MPSEHEGMIFELASFDAEKVTTTDQGFLVLDGMLARPGIQQYRAMEISPKLYPEDPLRIIKVYRPHSEVFDRDSLASFENNPVTLGHHGTITADNWSQLAKGEVRDVRRDGNLVRGRIIIKSSDAIKAVKDGTHELSNGYTNTLDFTPGTTPQGEAYDAVQRQIRGNHVALVKKGRCGSECRVLTDSEMEIQMTTKLTIDGIPVEVNEIAAAAIGKLQSTVADQQTSIVTLQGQLTDANKLVQDAQAKVTKLEDDLKAANDPSRIATAAQDWAVMVVDAESIAPGFKPTNCNSCTEYRRQVITKAVADNASYKTTVDALLGSVALADASPDMVQAAFRLLHSTAKAAPAAKSTSNAGKHFLASTAADADAEVLGASLFHQRMRTGFATKENQ